MAVLPRRFAPKEGVENYSVTLNPRNAGKPVHIGPSDWPYQTKDDDVIRALSSSRNVEEVEAEAPKATTGAVRAAQNLNVKLEDVRPSDGEKISADDVKNHAEQSESAQAGEGPDASAGGQGVDQPEPPKETV